MWRRTIFFRTVVAGAGRVDCSLYDQGGEGAFTLLIMICLAGIFGGFWMSSSVCRSGVVDPWRAKKSIDRCDVICIDISNCAALHSGGVFTLIATRYTELSQLVSLLRMWMRGIGN